MTRMRLRSKATRSTQAILLQSCLKINSILIFSTPGATTLERQQIVRMSRILQNAVENAKLFKEDLLRRNVKNSNTLNLQSLRLGINAIIALSNAL